MEHLKLASAYLQEAARTLHATNHIRLPFVQDALQLINQAYASLQLFDACAPRVKQVARVLKP